MAMRTTWMDEDGDEIELNGYTKDGELSERGALYLCDPKANPDGAIFAFTPDDAESFAEHLLAWAKKQRGVK